VPGPTTSRARRPPTAVRAVVFDFGGVLITPITDRVETLAARHGADSRTLLEVLLGPRETGEHPWHRAERGELPVSEIQAMLGPWADEVGMTLHGDEIDVLLDDSLYDVVHPVVDRIRALRAEGFRTGLLTNTFAEFRPTLERDIDLSLFDAVVESYAVGARKPEAAIYESTALALDVPHDSIVYLDDFDQNLEPADALGWTTIHVTEPLAALHVLDTILTETSPDSGSGDRSN
jgi:putative hydrolase of the HAD superfamily